MSDRPQLERNSRTFDANALISMNGFGVFATIFACQRILTEEWQVPVPAGCPELIQMDTTAEIFVVSSRVELRARFSNVLRSCGLPAHESDPDPDVLSARALDVIVIDLTERSGMDLLRAATASRPEVRLLSIGYPPEPQQVEEATRLGVQSFLAEDLREADVCNAVSDALDPSQARAARYESYLERARESFRRHEVRVAEAIGRGAIALDPSRPEAYNLVGVACEATAHRTEALKFYQIALVLDPTYELAKRNAETAAKPPAQRGPAEFE